MPPNSWMPRTMKMKMNSRSSSMKSLSATILCMVSHSTQIEALLFWPGFFLLSIFLLQTGLLLVSNLLFLVTFAVSTHICMAWAEGQTKVRPDDRQFLKQHINNGAEDADQYRLHDVENLLALQSKQQHKKEFGELCCTAIV